MKTLILLLSILVLQTAGNQHCGSCGNSAGNQELKLLPDQVISAAEFDDIDEILIGEEQGEAVYSITGTKKALILFIIPKDAEVVQKISIDTGETISMERPWWHFMALGV